MTAEKEPIVPKVPTTENPVLPTVTITIQELEYLKHGAHQYIESIGKNSVEGNLKKPVGFRPPQERITSSDSEPHS